jgi:uncharacterized membrane protein YhaH (DUF805 family)
MDMQTSIVTCFVHKYLDFKDRASLSEFWWFQLFYLILTIVAYMISIRFNAPGILSLVQIIFALPLLSVSVRRLHDINKSGWWILIALIPLVGGFILLYWYLQKGNIGPNQYGNG